MDLAACLAAIRGAEQTIRTNKAKLRVLAAFAEDPGNPRLQVVDGLGFSAKDAVDAAESLGCRVTRSTKRQCTTVCLNMERTHYYTEVHVLNFFVD